MKLKLLSLNLWQLPRPFSAHNRERLDRFIDYVQKAKPDIIACQEVWMKSSLNHLRKNLKEKLGYHCIVSPGIINRSGLVTFTKFKPIKASLHSFKKRGRYNFIERIVSKGFQKIKFKKFTLINSHLYNPMYNTEGKQTIRQFKQIKKATKDEDTVLLGDLNLDWKQFLLHNDDHFIHDNNKQLTTTRKNWYQNLRFNRWMESDFKDDYILFRSNTIKLLELKTRVIRKPLFSDHYALAATIIIK